MQFVENHILKDNKCTLLKKSFWNIYICIQNTLATDITNYTLAQKHTILTREPQPLPPSACESWLRCWPPSWCCSCRARCRTCTGRVVGGQLLGGQWHWPADVVPLAPVLLNTAARGLRLHRSRVIVADRCRYRRYRYKFKSKCQATLCL